MILSNKTKSASTAIMASIFIFLFFFIFSFFNANAETDVPRLKTSQDILDAFNRIVNFATSVMVSLAVVYFIYSAYLFASARGNETKITTARLQLTYSIVAIALILLAGGAFKTVANLIAPD